MTVDVFSEFFGQLAGAFGGWVYLGVLLAMFLIVIIAIIVGIEVSIGLTGAVMVMVGMATGSMSLVFVGILIVGFVIYKLLQGGF